MALAFLVVVYAFGYLPVGVAGLALVLRAQRHDVATGLTLLGLVVVALAVPWLALGPGAPWPGILLSVAPGWSG